MPNPHLIHTLTCEVEVGVLHDVDGGGGIGRRADLGRQLVGGARQAVRNSDVQVPGVALLACWA
eukprot:366324-Chlamydomonas_euryale.AAC.5